MTPPFQRIVLVAGFGPPSLAAIRSWGRLGCQVALLVVSRKPPRFCASRFLHEKRFMSRDLLYTEEGLTRINQFVADFRADAVTAITEHIAQWLGQNGDRLPGGTTLLCPPPATLDQLSSKRRQTEVASEVGFDVLPTYYLDKCSDTHNNVLPEHFPLALRPATERGTRPFFKIRVVFSVEDLRSFLESLQKVDDEIIAQPFLDAPNTIVHATRTAAGATFGLQAFTVPRKFQGISLALQPTTVPEELCRRVTEFADSCNIVGSFHVDFIHAEMSSRHYFLEANCRLGGTTAKVAKTGYDEPAMFLHAFTDARAPSFSPARSATVVSRHALLKYVMCNLVRQSDPWDYPSVSAAGAVAYAFSALFRTHDDVWDGHDLRGSLALYGSNLVRKFRQ